MSLVRRKIYLTFPTEKTREAIICDMYDQYKVRFNLRTASVNQQVGLIALELEGNPEKIDQAIEYFRARGVMVEPVELDIIEG